ncbi:hypothetical protein NKH37_10885 [Mesorhizobium sp. M1217]|uniref:hypothetical protein n=1 Tax=Mesorhizobium sp. M1217 TaxID=2957070 RepID=UPI00333744D8
MTPFFAARQDRLLLMLIRTVALVGALALAGLLPAMSQAHAQDAASWTGVWDTKWRGGGAQIKFEQTGADVKGVYPLYSGRIEAKAEGDKLVGHWFEGDRQGAFTFVQSPDGESFMGRFDVATAEWWTGVRVSAVEDVRVDQSSPMSTMRSFLQTMNESGADNVPRATGGGVLPVWQRASSTSPRPTAAASTCPITPSSCSPSSTTRRSACGACRMIRLPATR